MRIIICLVFLFAKKSMKKGDEPQGVPFWYQMVRNSCLVYEKSSIELWMPDNLWAVYKLYYYFNLKDNKW